jgi:hypothetical protein
LDPTAEPEEEPDLDPIDRAMVLAATTPWPVVFIMAASAAMFAMASSAAFITAALSATTFSATALSAVTLFTATFSVVA